MKSGDCFPGSTAVVLVHIGRVDLVMMVGELRTGGSGLRKGATERGKT